MSNERPHIRELASGNTFSRSRLFTFYKNKEWRLGDRMDALMFAETDDDERDDDDDLSDEAIAKFRQERQKLEDESEMWPEGDGLEFIDVIELAESRTLNLIAVYRRWIVNPAGDELKHSWAPKRRGLRVCPESRLRQMLNGGRFYRGSSPPSWQQQQQIDEREREHWRERVDEKGPVLITMVRIEKLKAHSAFLTDSDLSFLNDLCERAAAMKKRSVLGTHEEWSRLFHLEYESERREAGIPH